MEITGKITHIGAVQTGEGQKGTWNKFQAVITETEGQYPKSLAFDVFNDKVSVAMDEVCTIHFETKANLYQGKYYTNISAWRKTGGGTAQAAPAATAATLPTSKPTPTAEQWEAIKTRVAVPVSGPTDYEKALLTFDLTDAQVSELKTLVDLPF